MMVNIKDELAFYGAYHSNFANQIVHLIFVPMILASAFALVSLAVNRNASFLVWVAYACFYLFLDPVVGTIAALFYLAIWFATDALVSLQNQKQGPKGVPTMTKQTLYIIAVGAQVVSWAAQVFIGHAIFERNKPALFESVTQAFSLAPLFVVYETIWMVFPGFRAGLHHDVQMKIDVIHNNWRMKAH